MPYSISSGKSSVFALCVVCLMPAWAAGDVAADLLALTGGKRVKVVWERDTTAGGHNGIFDQHKYDVFQLWGFDTQDGASRALRSQIDNYAKPLITHDGARVVFTDAKERKVRVVDWDGSNLQTIANGFATAIWYDASQDIQWVYYAVNAADWNARGPLKRFNLDNTTQEELVYDQYDTMPWWMAISGDGSRIVGSWTDHYMGLIIPYYDGSGNADHYWHTDSYYMDGCWSTITPDTTYRVAVFDYPHKNWYAWDWPPSAGANPRAVVTINTAPGIGTDAVYYPKHSNHPRFFVVNGPLNENEADDHLTEIFFGKFNSGFTSVTDWVQVNNDDKSDSWPDAWVDPGTVPLVKIDSFTVTPQNIQAGQSATLAWQTSNATLVSIAPGIGTVSADGNRQVSPGSTTTYTLTAEGPGGPVSQQVTLEVSVPQLDSIVVSPASSAIGAGESIDLVAEAFDQFGSPYATGFAWSTDGGGWLDPTSSPAGVVQHTTTFTSDGSAGAFTVTCTAEGVSGTATVVVWPAGHVHVKINCGDGSPDVSGWEDEDAYRSGGTAHDFTGSVDINGQPNAAPEEVYITCVNQPHTYSFPVPDGTFLVRLHFYDTYGVGRSMDYTIEGVKVLDDFDIAAPPGGVECAVVKEFQIVVDDGDGMQILAEKDQGNDVFESGIEILSVTVDSEDPQVFVTEPADGATVSGDLEVKGTASDDVEVARVEVSLDGGSWEQATGTTDWSFGLMTSPLLDGEHQLRARATDTAGKTAEATVRIITFNTPTIMILSPEGGESWEAGSVQHIMWTTQNLDNATIHFSPDDGENWQVVAERLSDSDSEWGNYPWVVPPVSTDLARIRIMSYFQESPTVSNPFTIVGQASTIKVLHPQGGETFTGLQTVSISWEAPDSESVVLEYSIDEGRTWETLGAVASDDPSWGEYSWSLPNVSSRFCQIRVRDPDGGQGVSGLFAITPVDGAAGALDVTAFQLRVQVPPDMAGLQSVRIDGKPVEVDTDGEFEVRLEAPFGVTSLVLDIHASKESKVYRRLLRLDVKDE